MKKEKRKKTAKFYMFCSSEGIYATSQVPGSPVQSHMLSQCLYILPAFQKHTSRKIVYSKLALCMNEFVNVFVNGTWQMGKTQHQICLQ